MRRAPGATTALGQEPAPVALPAVRRLNALTSLDPAAVMAIRDAAMRAHAYPVQAELVVEGQPITGALLVLEGWAARVRLLSDGRRAIMSFLLPGDLIGVCDHPEPLSASSIVALTPVVVCAAPDPAASPSLARAFALSRAMEEAHLLAQIARLSRLNAYDRLADLMLELLERFEAAGLATRGSFALPLTQEILSNAVGLSTVHLNRTVQHARRSEILTWSGHKVRITDPAGLREQIGRQPVRVTGLNGPR